MAKGYSVWVIEFRSKTSPGDWARLTPDAAPKSLAECEDEVRAHPGTQERAATPLLFRFRNVRSGETRDPPVAG